MEQTPVASTSSRSFPKWIVFVLGLLIGAGAGYGVFAYFAPNAEEIAETVRLDIEEKNDVSLRKMSGEAVDVTAEGFILRMTYPGGEVLEFNIATNEETQYFTLEGLTTRDQLVAGARVAVTTIEAEALVAEEVLVLE